MVLDANFKKFQLSQCVIPANFRLLVFYAVYIVVYSSLANAN